MSLDFGTKTPLDFPKGPPSPNLTNLLPVLFQAGLIHVFLQALLLTILFQAVLIHVIFILFHFKSDLRSSAENQFFKVLLFFFFSNRNIFKRVQASLKLPGQAFLKLKPKFEMEAEIALRCHIKIIKIIKTNKPKCDFEVLLSNDPVKKLILCKK